jgi:hypothetical protein
MAPSLLSLNVNEDAGAIENPKRAVEDECNCEEIASGVFRGATEERRSYVI